MTAIKPGPLAPAPEPPALAPGSSIRERERAHSQAIDRGYFANKALVPLLGENPPPHTATTAEGLKHYSTDTDGNACPVRPEFGFWLYWRSMALIVDTWDDLRGVKRVTPTPAPALPQPDEAPGLDVPTPTDAEHQPRLAGTG